MKLRRKSFPKIIFLLLLLMAAVLAYKHFTGTKDGIAIQNAQPSTPEARDAARVKYLTNLKVAINQYRQNHGSYPFVIPKNETAICNGTSLHCKQAKLIDLNILVSEGLIASIPSDPNGGKGQYNSGFSLRKDADGLVLLAPRTENAKVITIKL